MDKAIREALIPSCLPKTRHYRLSVMLEAEQLRSGTKQDGKQCLLGKIRQEKPQQLSNRGLFFFGDTKREDIE